MGNDPRVEVKGFVSDEELHDICLRASLFLNTRNPNNGDNILNFPSKIPNYLAYGKPVVSTWLSSLSNDYRLYLQVVEPDDPLIFARRVEEILAWSDKQSQTHYRLLKEWFVKNKLWNIQAERFKNWMNSI
jgi:glycosyltransferase involved in cell wall biosynthesis